MVKFDTIYGIRVLKFTQKILAARTDLKILMQRLTETLMVEQKIFPFAALRKPDTRNHRVQKPEVRGQKTEI